MPELPEVEIVKQSLDQKIKLKKIHKVIIKNRNLRFKIPLKFEKNLINKVIKKVTRFSKYLIINFTDNTFCIIHLGMSGTIHLIGNKNYKNTNTSFYGSLNLPIKHNHIIIFFKKYKFIYNDPRRFGFVKILKNEKKLNDFFINIGPEPLDIKFKTKYIFKYLKGKKKCIKSFLLDQKFTSGIGNIYANEILNYSKINPFKSAMKLSEIKIKKIRFFSKYVLRKAIKKGGSSIRDFKNISGKNGKFQDEFKVYNRENLNCPKEDCYGKIEKKIVSKRSTFFCNSCQN